MGSQSWTWLSNLNNNRHQLSQDSVSPGLGFVVIYCIQCTTGFRSSYWYIILGWGLITRENFSPFFIIRFSCEPVTPKVNFYTVACLSMVESHYLLFSTGSWRVEEPVLGLGRPCVPGSSRCLPPGTAWPPRGNLSFALSIQWLDANERFYPSCNSWIIYLSSFPQVSVGFHQCLGQLTVSEDFCSIRV